VAAPLVRLAGVRHQAQEAELNAGLVVSRDKRPFSLTANDQIFCGEFVDGLADGALTNFVSECQLDFAGNKFARLPLARLQTLGDQRLDLLIKRAESGRRSAGADSIVGSTGHGGRSSGLVHDGQFHHKSAFNVQKIVG
jgi:hypothetical protein